MDKRTLGTGLILGLVAVSTTALGVRLAPRLQGGVRASAVPTYWDAPQFSLIDHTGAPLGRDDLGGVVWLASFIYTRCPDVCPLITRHMARLRDDLAADGLLGSRVRLVSFSVDPAHDTPEVLRGYAAEFGAVDPGEWAFLTGEPGTVRAVVSEGFRLAVSAPAAGNGAQETGTSGAHDDGAVHADHPGGVDTGSRNGTGDAGGADTAMGGPDMSITHSDRIILVDAAGRVRGFYSATDSSDLERLEREIRAVLRE